MIKRSRWIPAFALVLFAAACGDTAPPAPAAPDADAFLKEVNATMLALGKEAGQAAWVYSTYITDDTEALNAKANQKYIEAIAKYAKEAAKFNGTNVSPDARRQLDLLKLALVLVTPSDPKEAGELTTIAARLEGTYGMGMSPLD
jgi:peptidyl-dipeptidase A